MTTFEKAAKAIKEKMDDFPLAQCEGEAWIQSCQLARAAIESLRTSGVENTERIFNAMLDRILKEEV